MLCLKCGARVPWEDREAALGLDFGDDITRLNAAFALAGSVPWAGSGRISLTFKSSYW